MRAYAHCLVILCPTRGANPASFVLSEADYRDLLSGAHAATERRMSANRTVAAQTEAQTVCMSTSVELPSYRTSVSGLLSVTSVSRQMKLPSYRTSVSGILSVTSVSRQLKLPSKCPSPLPAAVQLYRTDVAHRLIESNRGDVCAGLIGLLVVTSVRLSLAEASSH